MSALCERLLQELKGLLEEEAELKGGQQDEQREAPLVAGNTFEVFG